MYDVTRCPLTARQYELFEHLAQGKGRLAAATEMTVTIVAVNDLAQRACASLGADDIDDALRILDDTGWLPNSQLSPAALEYVKAFEAYIFAPRDCRDEIRMRELCDAALDELLGS